MVHGFSYSTFPTYFMAGCISFPTYFPGLCLYYSVFSFITMLGILVSSLLILLMLIQCIQIVLGNVSIFPTVVICQTSLLTNTLHTIHLFYSGNLYRGCKGHCIWKPYWIFFSRFNTIIITSLSYSSIKTCTCSFKNPLRYKYQ